MTHRSRRLWLLPLENRVVPAGTTIITHGYSLSSQFGSDSWIRAMGNAIAARSPEPDVFLMYDFASGELRFDGGAKVPTTFQADTTNEYMVYVNWESASTNSTPGWAEATAEGLYGTLRRYGLADINHPLHFIAHSYGTVVNSEVIQRLGFLDGLPVDQMTTLDPHDFYETFSGFIFPNFESNVNMPDVHVWSNIAYADNYYNTAGKSTLVDPLPHGRALDGSLTQAAINVNLSSLSGFNVNGHLPHSRVHEYYALTIDPSINLFDNVDHSTWFSGPSTDYGFRFSRIGVASTPGGTQADRDTHWAGYTQRTNLGAPPVNPTDVGIDPPSRFYNGDFFNTASSSGALAGFTTAPQIGGTVGNPAALLNNSGKTFTHAPALIPLSTSQFAFDFNVTNPSPTDTLTVSFKRDDNQVFNWTDPDLLKSAGSGIRTLTTSNFADFNQLAGRMAAVSFTLNAPAGTATALTVDNLRLTTANPTGISVSIADGQTQRSRVDSLTVTFQGLVPAPSTGAFSIVGPGGSVDLNFDSTPSTSTQTILRVTFSGSNTEFGSLKDGNYTFTINGTQLVDALGQLVDGDNNGTPGGAFSLNFYRLFGDSNGDRSVTSTDFAAFRGVFGTGSSFFDFNNDGQTNSDDFAEFRKRFGIVLTP